MPISSNEHKQLVHALNHIAASLNLRDVMSVSRRFCSALIEHSECLSCQLYDYHRNDNEHDFKLLAQDYRIGEHNPKLQERDDLFLLLRNCVLEKQVLSEGCYVASPVLHDNKVLFCWLLQTSASENAKNIGNNGIASWLKIYNNFHALIYENDHDSLTGLLNRKTFDASLHEVISRVREQNSRITCNNRRTNKQRPQYWIAILDIDHFKNVNDSYGHMFGDEVLLLFANLLRRIFRQTDLLFRFGGEEFIVVIEADAVEESFNAFERFRTELAATYFPQLDQITVSIGLSKLQHDLHHLHYLEQADIALYYAKEHGRNQVCIYDELLSAGKISPRTDINHIDLFGGSQLH